jgi:hypothetical protein
VLVLFLNTEIGVLVRCVQVNMYISWHVGPDWYCLEIIIDNFNIPDILCCAYRSVPWTRSTECRMLILCVCALFPKFPNRWLVLHSLVLNLLYE